MATYLILGLILLAAGAVVVGGRTPFRTKTRDESLTALTRFVEGALEPIKNETYPNSFRIRFTFEGREFVYEDWEKQGFKGKVYTASLKTTLPRTLTLTVAAKERSNRIRTDIFIASQVSTQHIEESQRLKVPALLKEFKLSTNDAHLANKFLENGKVSSVYKSFKQIDAGGNPVMPLQIVDGTLALEIFGGTDLQPNIPRIYRSASAIEVYLNQLLVLIREIEKF